EEDLIFALKDKDKSIRILAIKAVGRVGSEEAIPDLLSILGTLDADIETAAIHSLVQIGEKAVKAVAGEVEAGRLEPGVGKKVFSLFDQQQVEEALSQFVSDDGGFGYYEGMFENLKILGVGKAVPVLHRIIEDSSYQSRLDSFKGNRDQFNRALRELSIMAVGDLGGKESIPRLKKALKRTTSFGFDDEHSHLIVALYKLGDRASFQKYISRREKEASKDFSTNLKEDGYEKLFSIGLVQNRVGQRKAALEVYEKLVDRIEKSGGGRNLDVYPDTLYNLACLQALSGEKSRALQTLRKAVEAGFIDKGWIEQDGDLQSLREEEAYRALMAEKALFEQK
ncbi:MAG: HEAT repeat domain-containing protein, partial [Planctomycetota bacterium]|nr:HEAT repeat domain-containing protein [Planctomycetota bacterium]